MPEQNLIFGPLGLDDKIADCPYEIPANPAALLERFGRDATWRDVLKTARHELLNLPGYASKTVDRLYAFMSAYVEYSFTDLL